MTWQSKDNTYNDIREKSLFRWLEEMSKHEDIAVRGGVRLAEDYLKYLKEENHKLQAEIDIRNSYLQKLRKK